MCFSFSLDGVRRMCGYDEDEIYDAKLWWANLAISILPAAYYESSRIRIDRHRGELRTAHAILQRMQQLSQENGAEIYIYNLHPDTCPRATSGNAPHEVKYTDQDRIDDIRRLRAEFLSIQKYVSKGSDTASNDAVTWKYKNYWRRDEDNGYGRSRLWESRRQACAYRGGCCARECGCCEKILYEYPLRDWGNEEQEPDDTMYMRKVYAHCTSECGCCVITHGVYEPDPHLPDPGFVVAGRSDE